MKLTKSQKYYIQKGFSEMKEKEDFLKLLNTVKTIIYGEDAYAFSLTQLNYYINTAQQLKSDTPKHYQVFKIKKKSGGLRVIYAPNKGLLAFQKVLNCIIQSVHQPHAKAYGFVVGKSIVDNANSHIGQQWVYNIDLKDFFPSIPSGRVYGRLLVPPFNLGNSPKRKKIANAIKALTTAPFGIENSLVLPQGAPTSPALTNAICDQLDRKLNTLAKKNGLRYSRYADDITFSSNNSRIKAKRFEQELRTIIELQNFSINEQKVRLQHRAYRQEVTGIIVNKKSNVNQKYIKQVRHWLYVWEKYGLKDAQIAFNQATAIKNDRSSSEKSLSDVLNGKLNYLKMVKGTEDTTYKKLKMRYNDLVPNSKNVHKFTMAEAKQGTFSKPRVNIRLIKDLSNAVQDASYKNYNDLNIAAEPENDTTGYKNLLELLNTGDYSSSLDSTNKKSELNRANIVDDIINKGLEEALKNWTPND